MKTAVVVFTAVFVIFITADCGPKSVRTPATQPAPTPVVQPTPVAQPAPTLVSRPAPTAQTDQLDAAIREASDYLNKNLAAGNKLVILNIQSDYPALSEYIIDELIANTVNDRVFKIVDRKQLDAIRSELQFQMSGEVDDNSAQRAGQILGAQTIISGGVTKIGDIYRMRIRALSVESAQIEGQFNRNIPSGATIEMLAKSSATGYGGGSSTTVTSTATTISHTTTTTAATPQTIQPNATTGVPQTQPDAPQAQAAQAVDVATPLTVGTMVPGGSLAEKLAWLQRSADSHNTYVIVVNADERVAPTKFEFRGAINITIALRGDDTNRIIRLKSNGTMFTVGRDVTFILENNITLHGHSGNRGSMVRVASGGIFKMATGSTITGNANSERDGAGGGVHIEKYAAAFEMTGGIISKNTAAFGGGVFVGLGKERAMRGGTISDNNALRRGGGLYVGDHSEFRMNGGIITNNTAGEYGGGVSIAGGPGGMNGKFNKIGGTITGYVSDPDGGNAVKDETGNVLARRGHAVYGGVTYGAPDGKRKETTVGLKENLSYDGGKSGGDWDGR